MQKQISVYPTTAALGSGLVGFRRGKDALLFNRGGLHFFSPEEAEEMTIPLDTTRNRKGARLRNTKELREAYPELVNA
jgi:hypothetical protein